MDNSEEKLRQEAIRLYLQNISVSLISRELSRSRQWVHKWIAKYKNNPSTDWYKSESRAPKRIANVTPSDIEKTIVKARKDLVSRQYSQQGAISILYELDRIKVKAPSISTINRILKKHDLIGDNKRKKYIKTKEYPSHYCNVQQMDLIGPRYLTGGFKYYIYTIIDIENHFAGVYPIQDKSAKSIAPSIVDFWSVYQMPDYLQMDNELSFRGSNRYPRGLGLLMRIAISNEVTPLFIPVAEPWRNGVIENFNNNVQKHFLSQPFTSLEDLQLKAKEFTAFHNDNHRYSSQNNKTPNELIRGVKYFSKLNGTIDLSERPHVDEGQLIFTRFIRSDLIINIQNTSFKVQDKLIYSYVEAIVQIEKHLLIIKHRGVVYHYFEFIMPLS